MANQVKEDEIVSRRAGMVVPLLFCTKDSAEYKEMKTKICEENGISKKTLDRYLKAYQENGVNGLRRKSRKGANIHKLNDKIIDRAVELRYEAPKRSVDQIIRLMEKEGLVSVGYVKRSTLQDALEARGYSARNMHILEGSKKNSTRFQKTRRNEMWMGDMMNGPKIMVKGVLKKTWLSVFVDDFSRHVVHAEFYASAEDTIVADSLKKAVLKNGIPEMLYLDNGKQYVSKYLKHICETLGIKQTFCKPHSPASKGKVERLIKTIQDSFMTEYYVHKAKTLQQLNLMLQTWLDECYENRKHGTTGETPADRFRNDPTELRIFTADNPIIELAFKRCIKRKVTKCGEITYKRTMYFVGKEYAGRVIDVYYNEEKSDTLYMRAKDDSLIVIKKTYVGSYVSRTKISKPRKIENPSNFFKDLPDAADSTAEPQSEEPDISSKGVCVPLIRYDDEEA